MWLSHQNNQMNSLDKHLDPSDINSSRKGQKYHCFSEKLQTVKIETQDMNVVSPRCNYYYFFG